jgi:hypothetical protein
VQASCYSINGYLLVNLQQINRPASAAVPKGIPKGIPEAILKGIPKLHLSTPHKPWDRTHNRDS